MARLKLDASARLEEIEGDLATLGNVRVLLHLVSERVRLAQEKRLLHPALDDLRQADHLLRTVQQRMSAREKL